ncbi:TonB-dependent receptor plug domain-containing protein [Tenacibaculum sp. UWU-22]|uniref:TonB-dependent receptor plug domain-containing protein n=1 Tax=Tenacibaculum sp. UWU-22 TaxID=3234187 RepID=UPI0034DB20C9
MKLIITSLILLIGYTYSFGQNIAKDSTKTIELDEVVITAQYAPKSERNVVYKVTRISSKAIQASEASNLTELLRNKLNVDLSYNSAFGAGIEMDGISKENIKILVDGVPLIGRVNGVLNLNQINLENIERIEIVRGPVSVFYGTDAIGGVINLITKKNQAKPIEGLVKTYYESVDAVKIDGSAGFSSGKNLLRIDSGTYFFKGINTDDNNTRKQNWPKRNLYNTNVKYIRNIGDFKLNLSSNFSKENVYTLGEISSRSNTATDIDYTTRRWDNSINLQGKFTNNHYLDATVSYLDYDRYDTSYKFNPTDNTSTLIVNNPDASANYFDTFFAKVQYAKSDYNKKLNYAFGVEQQSDYAEGNRILNDKQSVKNTSAYTSINYKLITNLEIQPAIRYTYNSSFKSLWSPAFNVKYAIDSQNILRFAYGKGYRAPSIKELYLNWSPTYGPFTYTFTGNENLKVESSQSFNFNYTYNKNLENGGFFKLEPSIYYNKIIDLIGLSQLVNFERHYINLNKTKAINYVVEATYKTSDRLEINLGLAYLGRYLEYTDEFNSGGYLYTPSASSSIFYNIKPINTNFNVFYKYNGKREGNYIEKDNTTSKDVLKKSEREAFNNLDVSLSKNFTNGLAISVGAKNLFNVKDIETFNEIGTAHNRDMQLWGTSYFVSAKFNF